MRVILHDPVLALAPDNEQERADLAVWLADRRDHVLHIHPDPLAKGAAFLDLGLRATACREPINILFDQGEECWRPISNLALSPFRLHDGEYASVEGFWQGLKFSDPDERARIARLWGKEAKRAGAAAVEAETFVYQDCTYHTGAYGHWSLMRQACEAKFVQDFQARAALLATGDRPLTHKTRRDSHTIPGALLADIWMRLRGKLQLAGV